MRRFTHSQGFGMQSPSAYRFNREVTSAHYSYDAYTDLKQAPPRQGRLTLELARLYFHVARAIQTRQWVLCTRQNDVYCAYVQAGCRMASPVDVHEVGKVDKVAASNVLITVMEDGRWPMCEAFVSRMHKCPILIVEGIYASKEAKVRWKELVSDTRTGVAFDLYDYGIIFFDHTKSRQVCITNF